MRLFLMLIQLVHLLIFLILVFIVRLLDLHGYLAFRLRFRSFVEALRVDYHRDLFLLLCMLLIENLIRLALLFLLKFRNNLKLGSSFLVSLKVEDFIFKISHLKI